jgi:hypothetical protein
MLGELAIVDSRPPPAPEVSLAAELGDELGALALR